MKYLELDLEKIARRAEQKEDENFEFRAFLKGQDSKKIDKIVHRLHEEITSRIDCRQCGNCCKSLRPCLTDAELEKLSGLKNISSADFESRYVAKDIVDNTKYLKDTPCIYLKGTICSVYDDRPHDCKSYPHTHKKGFTSRTLGVIENYGICPIVYNLYEQLKEELDYRYYY